MGCSAAQTAMLLDYLERQQLEKAQKLGIPMDKAKQLIMEIEIVKQAIMEKGMNQIIRELGV